MTLYIKYRAIFIARYKVTPTLINFKTEKEPKMILFDFGAFQKNMQMLSHDKIIAHMIFGVFHMTFRTITFSGWGYNFL